MNEILSWPEFAHAIRAMGRSPESIVGWEIRQEVGAISEGGEFVPASTRTGALIVTFDDGYTHTMDITIERSGWF